MKSTSNIQKETNPQQLVQSKIISTFVHPNASVIRQAPSKSCTLIDKTQLPQ
jgi:hypothetical protein